MGSGTLELANESLCPDDAAAPCDEGKAHNRPPLGFEIEKMASLMRMHEEACINPILEFKNYHSGS